jgi:large subunit ribosomal protein L30
MASLTITQVKSEIGGTAGQRATLRSLGLKHVGDTVVKQDRAEFRGMVAAVAHLVTVQETE